MSIRELLYLLLSPKSQFPYVFALLSIQLKTQGGFLQVPRGLCSLNSVAPSAESAQGAGYALWLLNQSSWRDFLICFLLFPSNAADCPLLENILGEAE